MLVKPPLTIGSVAPATAASAGVIQCALCPTTASRLSMTTASTAWLSASAARRYVVLSSHVPSSGP